VKRLTLFFVALFFCDALLAQLPDFNTYMISGPTSVSFKANKPRNKAKAKTEVPPWIIPGGWKSYLFVDGSDTYIWSSRTPLTVNRTINFKKEGVGPYNVSKSYIHSSYYDSARLIDNWKRTYHAIYSAALIDHPAEGLVSLGFLHGENKNLVSGNIKDPKAKRYPNTIQSNAPINPADHNSWSGGSPYQEGWNAYNGIISAAWEPNNKITNWGQQFFEHELGPIVWPATGYITKQGVKCTSGLRHPSSIVFNGYVYVFYVEGGAFGNNIPDEEGCSEGIKVARAPVSEALNPYSFQVYYKGRDGLESWKRSLPEGFTKESMLNYVAVKGAKATDIMNDYKKVLQEIRFSVAKVRNTNYFIGVEEYIDIADRNKVKVGLRFSSDLVHWSDCVFTVATSNSWDNMHINYPIFLSKDGWSNTEIDIDDFYITGTDAGVKNSVNKIHFQGSGTGALPFASAVRMQTLSEQNVVFPNPTKGIFKLAYVVDTISSVEINMYNLLGQQLQTVHGEKMPGKYFEEFDLSGYPEGVYLVAVKVGKRYRVYKVVKG